MLRFNRKILGVSIFELLLVLGIVSMVTVSAIQYVDQQRDQAAAKAYGVKLYTFGQAVTRYVRDAKLTSANPSLPGAGVDENAGKNAAYVQEGAPGGTPSEATTTLSSVTEDNVTTIDATGIDWLKPAYAGLDAQGVPYLPEDFTMEAPPFIVALPDSVSGAASLEGDAAFSVKITVTENELPAIQFTVGALYEPSQPPELAPVLTQEAITHANTLYNSSGNVGTVKYQFPYIESLQSQDNQVATPSGEGGIPTEVGVDPESSPGGVIGVLGDPGTATPPPASVDIQPTAQLIPEELSSIYLKIDGTNKMEGNLNFTSTGANAAINGVGSLDFAPGPNEMSFEDNGTRKVSIENLRTLSFSPSQPTKISNLRSVTLGSIKNVTEFIFIFGTASRITNLLTLNFAGPGSSMQKVNAIRFRGDTKNFRGVEQNNFWCEAKTGGSWDTGGTFCSLGTHDICYLNSVRMDDYTGHTDTWDGCRVIQNGANWSLKAYGSYLTTQPDGPNKNICGASCLRFQ